MVTGGAQGFVARHPWAMRPSRPAGWQTRGGCPTPEPRRSHPCQGQPRTGRAARPCARSGSSGVLGPGLPGDRPALWRCRRLLVALLLRLHALRRPQLRLTNLSLDNLTGEGAEPPVQVVARNGLTKTGGERKAGHDPLDRPTHREPLTSRARRFSSNRSSLMLHRADEPLLARSASDHAGLVCTSDGTRASLMSIWRLS